MARYIIWSEYKAEGSSTIEELQALEKRTGYSYSSVIEVNNISDVLAAIYNETDVDLQCHRIDPKYFY